MATLSKDQLDKEAAKQRERIVLEAAKSGSVPKEDFDNLDRLRKLAEDQSRPSWWRIPLLALATLCGAAFLLYKEEGRTGVELDAVVIGSSFRIPSPQPLMADQVVKRLMVDSLDDVAVGLEEPQAAEAGYTCSVDVETVPSSTPGSQSTITMQSFSVLAGWDVAIARPSGDQTELDLAAPPESKGDGLVLLRASVRGEARLLTDCGPNRRTQVTVKWAEPRSFTMHAAKRAHLVLTALTGNPALFARQIEFEQLRLQTVQRDQTGPTPRDSRKSALVSGSLYLDALSAKPVTLRPFEDLTFERSKGYFRMISAAGAEKPLDEAFRLQVHAAVEGMKADQRSLMPTWLEVIEASAGLRLFWSSVTGAIGIVMLVLRYFKWI